MFPVTRRTFLQAAGALALTAAGTCLSSCTTAIRNASANAKQVNVFSWADYLPPTAIEDFEKRFGIQVMYDTYASNEAMLARLEAGAVDYDVIVPSSYAVTKLKELNLLHPIEKDLLPNLKNLMGRFTNMAFDPGGKYSVPYTFGTTAIGYNSAAFSAAGMKPPDDWEIFWNPKFSGRMTLLEDVRETMGFALRKRGDSYNSTNPLSIRAAEQDLARQKPFLMCYTSDQVIIYLGSGDSLLSLTFSGDAHQASRWNKDVRYAIPDGGASLWVDSMCIPASAPHPANAHMWINYLLDPEVSAALTNYTYYATPNHAALKYVHSWMLSDSTLYPSEEMLDKCEQIHDIGNAILLYDRAWTELKCL